MVFEAFMKTKILLLCVCCSLFAGCVQNIKQGVAIPLTPEHRNNIETFGIVVRSTPFKVKYTVQKSHFGSAAVGGVLLSAIEGDIHRQGDDKLAGAIFDPLSADYDIREELAKKIQKELAAHGYENSLILSSEDQSQANAIDARIDCEVLTWGISIYPKVKPDLSVSTYIDLITTITVPSQDDSIWEYSVIYFNPQPRSLDEFNNQRILQDDINATLDAASQKIINRLINS